jgi:uncharacterized membrane protein YfcA
MMEFWLGLVAFFYAMVGHGGASGYLAVGALLGQPMASMKAQALLLNLAIAGTAAFFFIRARYMRWDLLAWLSLGSIPAAYFAATLGLSPALASGFLAFALFCSALRLFWHNRLKAFNEARPLARPAWAVLLGVGAALGFLAGLTGVGGGIYLSPLLLFLRWSDIKQTAAVSAAFIFVNSLAGLAGMATQGPLPAVPISWLAATLLGGVLGAKLGATWVPKRRLAQVLACVLLLAAFKLGAKAFG